MENSEWDSKRDVSEATLNANWEKTDRRREGQSLFKRCDEVTMEMSSDILTIECCHDTSMARAKEIGIIGFVVFLFFFVVVVFSSFFSPTGF